jgi:hypothetical protein
MVVFFDLEDDLEPPEKFALKEQVHWSRLGADDVDARRDICGGVGESDGGVQVRPNPNMNPMTESLGCYP